MKCKVAKDDFSLRTVAKEKYFNSADKNQFFFKFQAHKQKK